MTERGRRRIRISRSVLVGWALLVAATGGLTLALEDSNEQREPGRAVTEDERRERTDQRYGCGDDLEGAEADAAGVVLCSTEWTDPP